MFDNITIPALEADETITIEKRKKRKEPYPGYTMWGNGHTTKFGGKSVDVLDILKELGKPEMSLMQFLRDEMKINTTNKVEDINMIEPAISHEFTPYLKSVLKKNYAHMECLGILKRMKRGKYMLNPWLFIPTKDVERMKEIWSSLGKPDCGEQQA